MLRTQSERQPSKIKNLLRWLLPKFNHRISIGLIRWAARFSAWLLARIFALNPGVSSVYLRRSLAKGDFYLGLSDIDLLLVVNDFEDLEKFESITESIKRKIPLFDFEVCTQDELLSRFNGRGFHAYRLLEGSMTWKLLAGKPLKVFELLKSLTDSEFKKICFSELRLIWTLVNRKMFQVEAFDSMPILFYEHLIFKFLGEINTVVLNATKNQRSFKRSYQNLDFEGPDFSTFIEFHKSHYLSKAFSKNLAECKEWVEKFLKHAVLSVEHCFAELSSSQRQEFFLNDPHEIKFSRQLLTQQVFEATTLKVDELRRQIQDGQVVIHRARDFVINFSSTSPYFLERTILSTLHFNELH